MTDINQQITAIETEIRKTPYHKGTEKHLGILKAKLSKLKAKRDAAVGRGSSGRGISYAVKKQGDATVVLVGPPSVGKSTLINKLTNARSKIAPYDFTTVKVIPGMMDYKHAKLQILDVPGLIKGAEEGKGRGREVLSVVRGVDLLLIMTDVADLEAFERISKTLYKNGVRVNQMPPDVIIEKKTGGGLVIHSNIKQDLNKETIKTVASEFRLRNAEIIIKEILTMNRLIDAFATNRVYIPAIFVINKTDLLVGKKDENYIYISAENEINLEKLKEIIWQMLNFVRVYLVRQDQEPNFGSPIVMKKGQSLKDVAEKIGTEFAEGKTRAIIWGTGAKYFGQEVSLNTKVLEGMQVRFI